MSDSDGEGSEDNSMRPDIINGFERKSVELLDYVNSLEAQLEQQRTSFEHRETRLKADKKALEEECGQREAKLRADKKALEEKLHHALEQGNRTQKALLQEERKRMTNDELVRNLKLDVEATQEVLQNERQRSKEMEDQIAELKEQMGNRERVYNSRRMKDEKERVRLQEDITILRKKVTLGWILGCLTEVYLRLESENATVGSDATCHQRSGRGSNVLFKNTARPAKLECIEREVKRLIESSESPQALRKHQATASSRPALEEEEDSLSASDNDFVGELDLDSAAMNNNKDASSNDSCKPCTFTRSPRSADRNHHTHNHHHHRPRSLSPTSSLLNSRTRSRDGSPTYNGKHRGERHGLCARGLTATSQQQHHRSKSQPRSRMRSGERSSPRSSSPNSRSHSPTHAPDHTSLINPCSQNNSAKPAVSEQEQQQQPHHHHHHQELHHRVSRRYPDSSAFNLEAATHLDLDILCSNDSAQGRHRSKKDLQKIIATMECGGSSLTDAEKKQAVRDSIVRAFFGDEFKHANPVI